jgi:TolA-binding protein
MTGRDKIARDLGELLAEASGPDQLDERLARQKAAVVAAAVKGRGRHRRLIFPIVPSAAIGAVAAAACFAIWVGINSADDRIAFFVNDEPGELAEGHFIQTEGNREVIRFDGGHQFQFGKATKARVVKAGAGQVIVDLEQGEVQAEVVPGSRVAWIVRAGEYRVAVKGTVFSVNWDDSAAVLKVSVDRGKVAVHGPGVDEEGVFVSQGSSLRADASKGQITVEQTHKEETVTATDSQAQSEVAPVAIDASGTATAQDASLSLGKGNVAPPDWKKMYANKDFQGIMDLAEKKGVETIKRRLGKDELWIVANSARYVRNNRLADELFQVFRSRFPGAGQSQTAAFLLAKFALESSRMTDAERWFETYLSESPDGPLAEEALGRLISVYSKLGKSDKATESAEIYIRKYKDGYFTKQAGIVLNK